MKKISVLLILFVVMISCNHNDPNDGDFNVEPQSGWVNFSSLTTSAPENGNISIPVTLNASVNEDGLDVTYTVSAISDNTPNSVVKTYTQENVFLPGELTGMIEFDLPEVTSGDCYDIEITLDSTSKENVQVGLQEDSENLDSYPVTHMATIGKVFQEYAGTTQLNGFPNYQFTTTLTPIEGQPNTFTISTAWGEGYLPTLNPDLDDLPYSGTLTIDGQGNVTIIGDAAYTTGGEGTYYPCDNAITYSLTQSYVDSNLIFNVVLLPVQ